MKQRSKRRWARSLFFRLFSSTAAILCIGFTVIVIVTTIISTSMWREEHMNNLEQNTIAVAESFKEIDSVGYTAELSRTATAVANSYKSTVFFVTLDGKTYICSDHANGVECVHIENPVNDDIMQHVVSGNIYLNSALFGGMYEENTDTAGVRLVDENGEVVGAVFISSRNDYESNYTSRVLKATLLAALVILSVLFVVVYFYARSIVKPLRELSGAAKAMADGDFSRRVSVKRNDEIKELAETFNAMAESLESLEIMRSSFVSNVSHELKTPMTTIGGFVDAILNDTIPHERQNHYLNIVSDEVKRMSSLVNSMLSLSKLDSGQTVLQVTEVDVFEIICSVMISFERALERKNIEIIGADKLDTVMVKCDGQLIHQVIYNLFDNAVKFTPDGGYISIFIQEYDEQIEIYIKNSGEGISDEDIKHVFERFYKTDKSRSMDKSGVGLGLYLVKSIMNYHNGDISVKSVKGLYTEFTLVLPK